MRWQQIPLAQQSYQPRSPGVSVERVRNLYLESNPDSSRSPVSLLPTPGLTQWTTVGSGPIRGMEPMGPYLYVVSGTDLYYVDSLGAATLIGPVSGTGQVKTTNNGTHVGIAAGGTVQAANTAGIVSTILGGGVGAAYQDGYGIFGRSGTQEFFATDLDDMTTIDPLSFATADAQPDNIVGLISDHRELWIFKERTIEVWQNVGQSGFPFLRAGGGFVEHGCAATCSIAKAENVIYWLGDDKNVYRAAGYQAEPVSTPAIRNLIEQAASPSSCVAFTYSQAGHEFYVMLFSDLCLALDLTTGLWSERKSRSMSRWRASCHASYNGQELVGDYLNGVLWKLDLDAYVEGSDMLEREVVTPCQWGGTGWVTYHGIRLDCEMGQGLVSGQGSDPVALLSWSDDGGRTWCDERAATLGKIGEYRLRCEWYRLGRSRARSFRVRLTDPIPLGLFGLYGAVEVSS